MLKSLKELIRVLTAKINTNDRIEELKTSSIHLDFVSDSFKLDNSEFSSFRGIIHYLDKDGQWDFTDTGTYHNLFECIEETIVYAEYIKENWL